MWCNSLIRSIEQEVEQTDSCRYTDIKVGSMVDQVVSMITNSRIERELVSFQENSFGRVKLLVDYYSGTILLYTASE